MSDRPKASNGKRSQAWGTLGECPSCGQCLCFGCHPAGPCVDDADRSSHVHAGSATSTLAASTTIAAPVSWMAAPSPSSARGLRT